MLDIDTNRLAVNLIDAHTHPYARRGDSFVYDPTALLAMAKPFGVARAVTMLNAPLDVQSATILKLAADHPWLVPVLWIDPQRDHADDAASLLTAGFRGIKVHPTWAGYPADGPLMDAFASLCAEKTLPLQIHSARDDNAAVARVLRLAGRHPDTPIIMVHTGLGSLCKTEILKAMRPYANVYAETSWTNPESVCEAMAVLDSSRTLFGTDASVDGFDTYARRSIADPAGCYVYNYGDQIRLVQQWATTGAFENWAWLTAARLYRIGFAQS